MSVLVGFTGAADTLCAQAVGAGNWRSVGVVLQRALLVNTAFCLAIAAAWTRCVGGCAGAWVGRVGWRGALHRPTPSWLMGLLAAWPQL